MQMATTTKDPRAFLQSTIGKTNQSRLQIPTLFAALAMGLSAAAMVLT
jgi:hypothetical protein